MQKLPCMYIHMHIHIQMQIHIKYIHIYAYTACRFEAACGCLLNGISERKLVFAIPRQLVACENSESTIQSLKPMHGICPEVLLFLPKMARKPQVPSKRPAIRNSRGPLHTPRKPSKTQKHAKATASLGCSKTIQPMRTSAILKTPKSQPTLRTT